ncbi:MAG: polymerase, sigma-24 subunit, subfamily [Modestobacter sp.]|nr:polymerase, sigma-24 subunit, subfamily [Modestobacter sp.]
MDQDVDAAFSVFVAERRPALLRTALLLTGDQRSAEELVQRALTRTRRSWPRDPEPTVLRALVAGATSRWAPLTRAEQVIEALPATAPEEPDLAGALRELSPRTRAVVVLRWHERLPDAGIAQLLRCSVATVAAEAAAGLDRLRPALAPSAYERAAPDEPGEQRLREQLARLAAAPGRWRLGPAEAATDVRARGRGTRRRGALAAVAALCVVGVAVPLARWAPDPPGTPPTAATPSVLSASPAPVVPRAAPVLTGPTRGSLAGDAAFLDAVRTVGWGAQDAPPPAERQVVVAGDTAHGRVALVVGTVLEDVRGVWLTGPVGAAAGDLVPHVPRQLGRDRPLTLLLGGPGDATLVVVAGPGDEIAVSDRLMTGPRGTVGRSYTPVDAVDGMAVVPARTTALGPALSVRVTREGRTVYRAAVDWPGDRPDRWTPLPALSSRRPAAGAPDPHVVDAALTDLAVPLGAEPAALQPELLWSGELSLARGPGSVAVVVAHSPGGALVVTTWAGGGGGAISCGTQTPPGTTEVATLTVARVCDVSLPGLGQAEHGRWLVVTAPPEAVSAELLDSRGRVLGPLPLTGGSTVAQLTGDAREVRTLDADGQPVRETPIAPAPTDPFGDFGSGPAR